jgi:hypothetical protein
MNDYQDVEVVTLHRNLELGRWAPTEVAQIRRAIAERKQRLQSGLLDPTAEIWTKKLKTEVDPSLRMRNDPVDGYVIDRWTGEYWHQIPGKIGKQHIRPGLCDRMKGQYDMWKQATPKENEDAIANKARHPILKKKDQASQAVIAANEKASTDKVAAAVDSLSTKQVTNFLAVERARHTGETIIHHGQDLKFMEHVAEASKTTPPPPDDMGKYCGNPGMNPKVYKRKAGGKHIRE